MLACKYAKVQDKGMWSGSIFAHGNRVMLTGEIRLHHQCVKSYGD